MTRHLCVPKTEYQILFHNTRKDLIQSTKTLKAKEMKTTHATLVDSTLQQIATSSTENNNTIDKPALAKASLSINYDVIKSTLYYHKNKENLAYNSTDEIVLEEEKYTHTSLKERFLLVDTKDSDRILIFSANWQLKNVP